MKPHIDPSTMFFLLVPLLISVNNIPTSLGADDDRYTNCSTSSVSCGIIQSLTYPFWGGERASYCGLPEFQLTCESSNIPIITIRSLKYRLLHFNPTATTLGVVRDDYFNTLCPSDYKNNSFDGTPFKYVDSGLANVTFLYDCSPPSDAMKGNCKRDTTKLVSYLLRPLYSSYDDCRSVVMPIYAANLGQAATDIDGAIQLGFELQWMISNYEDWNACSQSGGQCGYDDGQFSCFCKDGPRKTSCSEKPSGILLFYQTPVFISSQEPWMWDMTLS